MLLKLPVISTISSSKKWLIACVVTAFLLVVLCLVQDYVRARLQQTGYYLSESLLFSSFWWLFAPLWFVQNQLMKLPIRQSFIFSRTWLPHFLWLVLIPVIIHLLLFPAIVMGISASFFENTFRFVGTLNYTLSEHLYLLFALYSIPVVYVMFAGKMNDTVSIPEIDTIAQELKHQTLSYAENLWVDSGVGTKIALPVSELTYCSANTPYVNLHTSAKKYLYGATLKALEAGLDTDRFVRIHKTTLVNIAAVASISSRQNGDYDITLNTGEVLRVSRHYAAQFKAKMEAFSLGLG